MGRPDEPLLYEVAARPWRGEARRVECAGFGLILDFIANRTEVRRPMAPR